MDIDNLQPATTYYGRAYVTDGDMAEYGTIIQFSTPEVINEIAVAEGAIDASPGNIVITINTNTNWQVTESEDWLSVDKTTG